MAITEITLGNYKHELMDDITETYYTRSNLLLVVDDDDLYTISIQYSKEFEGGRIFTHSLFENKSRWTDWTGQSMHGFINHLLSTNSESEMKIYKWDNKSELLDIIRNKVKEG